MLVGAQGDKQVMSFVQKAASDVVSDQAQAVWGKIALLTRPTPTHTTRFSVRPSRFVKTFNALQRACLRL